MLPDWSERAVDTSEDALVDRAVLGDAEALTSLLKTHGVPLHAELASRIGAAYQSVVDAADIVQITCIEAFLRIRSFVPAGPDSFRQWLRRIGENNLRDAIRALERDKRPSPHRQVIATADDGSYHMLVDQLPGTATTVSRAVQRNELRGVVEAALRQLPPDYEKALRLYELDGLSAQEVAKKLGRSHGAVRMLLARARDRLGELLGSESKYL